MRLSSVNVDYVVLPILLSLVAAALVTACVVRMRALRAKPYRRWRKVGERVALSVAGIALLAVAGSSLINAIAIHRFWRLHPAQGEMVPVYGYAMHLHCMGRGSPTLVLETGLGNDSLIWSGTQPTLAKTTRVCSYDRAGFGWSESRPGPRDADHIAEELHALLHAAGVSTPVVLMAHSIGGLYVRDYATRYPTEVAGMIFVDSSSPLQDKNPAFAGGGSGPPAWLLRMAMIAGVPRLMGMCSGEARDAGYAIRKLNAESICRMHYGSMDAELRAFDQSGEETVHTGPYGSVPILVISHDPAKALQEQHTAQDVARQKAWSEMQAALTHLSSEGRQIVAIGSTHYVQLDRPDLLEKEVPRFLEEVRGRAKPLTPGGSSSRE